MTHLNFSVEQHGGIYILLSGNVSTFFSPQTYLEKIQKRLFNNAADPCFILFFFPFFLNNRGHLTSLLFISKVEPGGPKVRRH